MKIAIKPHPCIEGQILCALCCLNCDMPMVKINKKTKVGREFGEDGWYCMNCKYFFFEREGILYYCKVLHKKNPDYHERCTEEYFALFVKQKTTQSPGEVHNT